jgi:hypothetical protein
LPRKKPANGKPARSSRKRRGKSEAMTEAKANAVEMRKAIGQDEIQLPKPDDYQYHRKQILGYAKQRDEANGRYRKALKTAQDAGVDTDAMLRASKLKEKNDPAGMMRHFQQLGFALGQEGYPIQLNVRDTLHEDTAALSETRGYDEAKAGRTKNNRYPLGSDLAAAYDRGFQRGTIENMPISDEAKRAHLKELDDSGPFPPDHNVAAAGAESLATH